MILVGLTGGIGSGKSTVANLFKDLGVPIYFSDDNAKRLMNTSKVIKKKLINKFGEKAFIDNKLNRPYLANIVFNNKAKLKAINAIVHPSVSNSFKRWTNKQKGRYVIQENAILFESDNNHKFDYIITVTAPLKSKINRVIERDNVTKQEVMARISNQLTDNEKIKRSNFVIKNIDLEKTQNQVLKIHKELMRINS